MTEQQRNFDPVEQKSPVQLSAKELHAKRFRTDAHNARAKKRPLREQQSKPPGNAVKVKPAAIPVRFKWALILAIFCFFLIGPVWALVRTFKLRRMIQQQELDAATHLSHKIGAVLMFSTIVGIFVWVAILFCTVGIIISGKLLEQQLI